MTETDFTSLLLLPLAPTWLIRMAAAPDLFLGRGLKRFLASARVHRARTASSRSSTSLAKSLVRLPVDLEKLLVLTDRRALGGSRSSIPTAKAGNAFGSMLKAARGGDKTATARLHAFLAGTVPFARNENGLLWLYVLGEPTAPARGVIASLEEARPGMPNVAFQNASTFALVSALEESHSNRHDALASELRATVSTPGIAAQESVRASFARAVALADMLCESDGRVRSAAKKLARKPFEPPPPPRRRDTRTTNISSALGASMAARVSSRKGSVRDAPLALGALVEAFFRQDASDVLAILTAQRSSEDRLVRDAVRLLEDALVEGRMPRTALGRDLARRRSLARRITKTVADRIPSTEERLRRTAKLIGAVDAPKSTAEPLAMPAAREEALIALAELGDPSAVPGLLARAVAGDIGAIDMLAALRDSRAIAPLVGLLRQPLRSRHLESAIVRALAALDAKSAASALRSLLESNPMPSWREGIERGALVKEIVLALGTLRDTQAGALLLSILEAKSQEYRAILPAAAWALGRIQYLPALDTLEQLLTSPKALPTYEAIWALGEISLVHASAQARTSAILEGLTCHDPGVDVVRLTALEKMKGGRKATPKSADLRNALERALWEPAFRQEESSRRRAWAFRSLDELSAARHTVRTQAVDPSFLGHDAVRYFVTRDDPRVRNAASVAFKAWGIPVPDTRRYYAPLLDELETTGGIEALHEALRDPLGVFRHNVATRLAERGDPASLRPLAEATARVFAEPPTSTYEYDDAPGHLVAFVRALAKLNMPEGNEVLIHGLRAGNHQVRAVVAENAPDDPRIVPELMTMLGDPRSFLRSRAERSLTALGVITRGSDRPPQTPPMPL